MTAVRHDPFAPRNDHPRCRRTGKITFRSYGEASARLASIGLAPGNATGNADHYRPTGVTERCEGCDGFHLTSKSGKAWAAGKGTTARRSPKRRGKNRRKKS